jgi:zinc D-Ala-D-Ala carboxypeptidase
MGTISKDFSYGEFERSATADWLGITNVITTFEVRDAVRELTLTLLQPLRDAWGSGIIISSGYRCPRLNAAVGGSPTSGHVTGYAADLVPANGRTDEFYAFVRKWLTDGRKPFDQCARETDRKGSVWVHLALKGPGGRQLGKFYDWTKK